MLSDCLLDLGTDLLFGKASCETHRGQTNETSVESWCRWWVLSRTSHMVLTLCLNKGEHGVQTRQTSSYGTILEQLV